MNPRTLLPTAPGAWAYVVLVTALAAFGFIAESTEVILLAAVLCLPASVLAIPAYYVVYGLLAQLPGANPNTDTGSVSCGPSGDCPSTSAGGLASWFDVTTTLAGIIMVTIAALLNVAILRRITTARREEGQTAAWVAANGGRPG